MEIKLTDRKWLESLTAQKPEVIEPVEKKIDIDNNITEIIKRLDNIETQKRGRKIIAKIVRDSFGKMESIVIEEDANN